MIAFFRLTDVTDGQTDYITTEQKLFLCTMLAWYRSKRLNGLKERKLSAL